MEVSPFGTIHSSNYHVICLSDNSSICRVFCRHCQLERKLPGWKGTALFCFLRSWKNVFWSELLFFLFKVNKVLAALQVEVENFILRMAAEFPLRKEQLIFLINNYDMMLAVLMVSIRYKPQFFAKQSQGQPLQWWKCSRHKNWKKKHPSPSRMRNYFTLVGQMEILRIMLTVIFGSVRVVNSKRSLTTFS